MSCRLCGNTKATGEKMNVGKKFEAQFKKSVPDNIFYCRYKDGTANFSGQKNENVRFQAKNICDIELYLKPLNFKLELKHHHGTSLPFSAIRENQLKELCKASCFDGIIAGFVVYFSDKEKCFFANASKVVQFKQTTERKSIPISWFEENGIKIEVIKKKVNCLYGVKEFVENMIHIDFDNEKTN